MEISSGLCRDVSLPLPKRVPVFPGEESAKSEPGLHVIGVRAFGEFGEILFVGLDRGVVVAFLEFRVRQEIANLLAELAFRLRLEDAAKIGLRRLRITCLERDSA